MFRTPLFVFAVVLVCAANADPKIDAWLEFDASTSLFVEPSAANLQSHIEQFESRYRAADRVLAGDEVLFSTMMFFLDTDPRLNEMVDTPQWLHGIDTYSSNYQSDLLEPRGTEDGPAHIWIAGWNGLILHSDDEGVNFGEQTSNTSANLQSIDFVDQYSGIAVGSDGAVVRTKDGGKGWEVLQAAPRGNHFAIDCVEELRCWLAGDYPFVYSTRDLGETWQRSESLAGYVQIRGLLIQTSDQGLAVGNEGIWRTDNSGVDWELVYQLPEYSSQSGLYGIDSADGTTVWAVGQSDGKLEILYSKDAGITWESQFEGIDSTDLPIEAIEYASALRATTVSAVDSSSCYIGTTDGGIYATTDSGRHWWNIRLSGLPSDSFYALEMINKRVGWVAGNMGRVMGTNSGARSWVPLRGAMYERILTAIEFVERSR